MEPIQRKPAWLKKRLPDPQVLAQMRSLLSDLHLHTICESGNCPNLGECWAKSTATFLILGNRCTRQCGFCNVESGRPLPIDVGEPAHIGQAVAALGLAHVVITSVTRDDIPDGGAAHFAATIRQIHQHSPGTTVEVLVPDFNGNPEAIADVLAAKPTIFAHNIETVERLHVRLRPRFTYERSLQVLDQAHRLAPTVYTKSSIMVGLGETPSDVAATMEDLYRTGCSFLTIGQYLQPSKRHTPVYEYVTPEQFEQYRTMALNIGYRYVASGPFVRSSFDAATALRATIQKNQS
ncbi:MAG TPA: lipoyl synthase [Firmicutes bacterium]|nr:lipoyl synthase [Bacillota bacterium]